MSVEDDIKTLLQVQIIKALKDSTSAIDSLVQAAMSKPVSSDTGRTYGYGNKVPFLEYLVGETIRDAARASIFKIMQEEWQGKIDAEIRERLRLDAFADSFTQAIQLQLKEDWCINVNFVKAERR